MAAVKKLFIFLSLLSYFLRTSVSEPISVGIGLVAVVFGGGYLAYCRFKECCDDRWIRPQRASRVLPWNKSLREILEERVHGQHIAVRTISRVVEGHVNNENPTKPLVLSLHGWTGTGKNFISENIATFLYKEGQKSKFIHRLIATHDFPHKEMVKEYKRQLKSWIHGNVTACGRSLFIFDEMDKIPEGLTDVMKPFFDHYEKVSGTDFRKSIFIFLSNSGAQEIKEETIKVWRSGLQREEITAQRMDTLLHQLSNNAEGGLWYSSLTAEKRLIDYFIPLLPLERSHVKKCIEDDMKGKRYRIDEQIVEDVINELEFYPQKEKVFSKSGCKKVSTRVDYHHLQVCGDDGRACPAHYHLQDILEEKVHGQHIAVKTISRALGCHLCNKNPKKALVLSLHGQIGTGKTFVTDKIAQFILQDGWKNHCIHRLTPPFDFPHKNKIKVYKRQLKSWIHGNVTACGRSLFIFDEMDMIPEGLIDVMRPFLDRHKTVSGADFRRSIFIFLSYSGVKEINKETLKVWRFGLGREEITAKSMDTLLRQHAYNSEGGLWYHTLIDKRLIDHFIPFLPLERSHVKRCIEDDMKTKGHKVNVNMVEEVVGRLAFYPEKLKIFSTHGCKLVSTIVDYLKSLKYVV